MVQTLVELNSVGAYPTQVVLWRLVVPLRNEHSASYGGSSHRDVIIVEVCGSDGVVGWGECPTFDRSGYVTETTETAWLDLRDRLVPMFFEGEGDDPLAFSAGATAVIDSDDQRTGRPSAIGPSAALAALRDAHLDNELRRLGRSLVDHLGVPVRPVERTVVIAAVGADADEIVRRGLNAVASGAALVKVKIAPGRDVEIVEAVAGEIGPSRVAVDANGSYDSWQQLAVIDRLGLAYIEQPFDPSLDPMTLGEFTGHLETPVALDESIADLSDLELASTHGSARIVSIKPARVGGLLRAAALVNRVNDLGLDAFVGGMVELGIGRAGALAIAMMPGCTLPTDLGPSRQYFDTDVTEPLETDADGLIAAPRGVATGRVPIPVILERFAVDRMSIQ